MTGAPAVFVKVRCPCGTALKVSDRKRGSVVRCPQCHGEVPVPHDAPEVPPKPVAETTPAKSAPPPRSKSPKADVPAPDVQKSAVVRPPPRAVPPPRKKPTANEPAPPTPPPSATAASPPPPPPASEAPRGVPPVAPPPLSAPPLNPAKVAPPRPAAEPALSPASAPAPQPAPEPPRRGIRHEPSRIHGTYILAFALLALAAFGAVPSVLDLVDHIQSDRSKGVACWAVTLFVVSLIEAAYAVYLLQSPDWSTVWMVAIWTLLIATVYAIVLGVSIVSRQESTLIQWLELQDKVYNGKATRWSFIMLSLTSLFAYFAGTYGVRWHNTFLRMRKFG